jgi:hypothetical protein
MVQQKGWNLTISSCDSHTTSISSTPCAAAPATSARLSHASTCLRIRFATQQHSTRGRFALDTQPISHQRTLEGGGVARCVHRPVANVAQQNETLIISTTACATRVHYSRHARLSSLTDHNLIVSAEPGRYGPPVALRSAPRLTAPTCGSAGAARSPRCTCLVVLSCKDRHRCRRRRAAAGPLARVRAFLARMARWSG